MSFLIDLIDLCHHREVENGPDLSCTEVIVNNSRASDQVYELVERHKFVFIRKGFSGRMLFIDVLEGLEVFLQCNICLFNVKFLLSEIIGSVKLLKVGQ
jgi:hypothetical protein